MEKFEYYEDTKNTEIEKSKEPTKERTTRERSRVRTRGLEK